MNTNDLYQQQIELELKSLEIGREAYLSQRTDKNKQVLEYDKTLTRWLNRHNLLMSQGIEERRKTEEAKRACHRTKGCRLTQDIDPVVLAYYTLRALCSSECLDTSASLTALASTIGSQVLESVNFERLKEANFDYYKFHLEIRKKTGTYAKDQRFDMKKLMAEGGLEVTTWDKVSRVHVGLFLIDIAVTLFDYWDVESEYLAKRERKVVSANDNFKAWITSADDYIANQLGVAKPMIHPPQPWTSVSQGGYLTDTYKRGNEVIRSYNKNYLESLDAYDLENFYGAINAVQATPYAVNKAVLEVVTQCWDQGIVLGSSGAEILPTTEIEEMPKVPEEYTRQQYKILEPEKFKQLMTQRATIYANNRRMWSKRIQAASTLGIAKEFAQYDRFYYPHNGDFRGRIYPIPPNFNPQGTDLSRGLLQFANGKPLGTDGAYWLHVHAANCWGVDKVSFADRVAWVERNMERILDSALSPMSGSCFWMEADKPLSALAVAFELLKYSIHGDSMISYLPIGMDGSCNGLQNFSALLRDPVGGKATNLVPGDKPNDIYAQVAEIVSARIEAEALKGEHVAVLWENKITRSTVKQCVMTLPYGATIRGMGGQIHDWLKKNYPTLFSYTEAMKASNYLAKLTFEAISEVVVAAVDAMDYLKGVARVLAKLDRPVSWETPVGFPVLQQYMKFNTKRVSAYVGGREVRLNVARDTYVLDKRRQSSGIAPNFAHSLDSSHLMLTTLKGLENGLGHFSMVHDSYAVHASDTSLLHACIREAFIEMYTPEVLTQFHESIKSQLSDKERKSLPDLPLNGDLGLDQIRESDYFFA